jgi:hypothetical protein
MVTAVLRPDHLAVGVTVVVGPGRAGDEELAIQTRCEVDGKVVENELKGPYNLPFLSAGEAFQITGDIPVTSAKSCELTVVVERSWSGPSTELGKRCARDGKLTAGSC